MPPGQPHEESTNVAPVTTGTSWSANGRCSTSGTVPIDRDQEPTRATNALIRSTKAVAVEALELLPRRQRRRVGDPVEEQPAVEVVALVLERARP